MSNSLNQSTSPWHAVAQKALTEPGSTVACPVCNGKSVTAAWNLVNITPREASVDLICSACNAGKNLRIKVPPDAMGCYPIHRFAATANAIGPELKALAERLKDQMKVMPLSTFLTSPLWDEARWCGTSYQWHAESKCPPVIALGFENPDAGRELFRQYTEKRGQSDQFDEIRITIIEGSPPGQRAGYTMHIYPDPEALAMYATGEGIVLDRSIAHFIGRWQRMYPVPGRTDMMLPRFKEEFARHKQFMIAPQVPRNGQNFADHKVGIIKQNIEFRQLSDITRQDDVDAGALVVPSLIAPRT